MVAWSVSTAISGLVDQRRRHLSRRRVGGVGRIGGTAQSPKLGLRETRTPVYRVSQSEYDLASVPVVAHNNVRTTKRVIRTDRYECPCCFTDLWALVLVACEGTWTRQWDDVEGLYRVAIYTDYKSHLDCRVMVEKLSGTKVFVADHPRLPQKDYVCA